MSSLQIELMRKIKGRQLGILKSVILLIFFFSINTFAQQNHLKIKGNLENLQKQKIENAEIYLYDRQNQIVKTTIAQNGFFEFSNLLPRNNIT